MDNHTPGPWKVYGEDIHGADYCIATTPTRSRARLGATRYSEQMERDRADRRLMAAAPELLRFDGCCSAECLAAYEEKNNS